MPSRLNAAPEVAATVVRKLQRFTRTCAECGGVFTASQRTAEFCGSKCRQTFNRRRRDRGADLYDLFMAFRHDRAEAAALRVQTMLNRMAMHWRDEDARDRPGRKSYHAPRIILARHPYLEAVATDIRRKGR